MGQRWSGSAEVRGPPNTGQVFGVGWHCGGARLVGRSEALDGALRSWWADGAGGADRGLIGEKVCFGGGQCAAVQMQIYIGEKSTRALRQPNGSKVDEKLKKSLEKLIYNK